jgi:hypothetical protein
MLYIEARSDSTSSVRQLTIWHHKPNTITPGYSISNTLLPTQHSKTIEIQKGQQASRHVETALVMSMV